MVDPIITNEADGGQSIPAALAATQLLRDLDLDDHVLLAAAASAQRR